MSAIAYKIESLGGACPVQAEGAIGGKKFYFRARWSEWSMRVYTCEEDFLTPEWYFEELYTKLGPGTAGYMALDEARIFIGQALKAYLAGAPTMNDD